MDTVGPQSQRVAKHAIFKSATSFSRPYRKAKMTQVQQNDTSNISEEVKKFLQKMEFPKIPWDLFFYKQFITTNNPVAPIDDQMSIFFSCET